MPTAYDVPADLLIIKIAEYLKREVDTINPPPWADFVKTGIHSKITPTNPDWWYVRCASILRKIYINGPIGVSRLRKAYGGKSEKSMKPGHFKRGGGAIVRKALQQLEKAGLVTILGKRGRVVTEKGLSLVDKLSSEIVGRPRKKTRV